MLNKTDSTSANKIRIIIIDDSAFMRSLLSKLLSEDPKIEIVDTAEDPLDAREKIKKHNPDLITLDIQMPKMDGLAFLEKVMTLRPMPVIMVSSLTDRNTKQTIRALELGAIDVCCKPKVNEQSTIKEFQEEITEKIHTAVQSNFRAQSKAKKKCIKDMRNEVLPFSNTKFIAIASSTGGTVALEKVLRNLPERCPPIAIAQHIPPGFSNAFAERINELSHLDIHEAVDGEILTPGSCVISPGKQHIEIYQKNNAFKVRLLDTPPVNRHKPSCDVLFDSVTKNIGRKALGIILTGMGKDGAHGLKRLHDLGAKTIAQSEDSSLIYGMPKQAIELGAAQFVSDLEDIPELIVKYARNTLSKN